MGYATLSDLALWNASNARRRPHGMSGVPTLQFRVAFSSGSWSAWSSGSPLLGSSDMDTVSAVEIGIMDSGGVGVEYMVNTGWPSGWIPCDKSACMSESDASWAKSGGTQPGKRLEAIRVRLVGAPSGWSIKYRVYIPAIPNAGWQPWVADGEMAGTSGKGWAFSGLEMQLVAPVQQPVYVAPTAAAPAPAVTYAAPTQAVTYASQTPTYAAPVTPAAQLVQQAAAQPAPQAYYPPAQQYPYYAAPAGTPYYEQPAASPVRTYLLIGAGGVAILGGALLIRRLRRRGR